MFRFLLFLNLAFMLCKYAVSVSFNNCFTSIIRALLPAMTRHHDVAWTNAFLPKSVAFQALSVCSAECRMP